jgi:glyoxylase-like metal-dependent hydrolase (beta-lactamase superfamily II)
MHRVFSARALRILVVTAAALAGACGRAPSPLHSAPAADGTGAAARAALPAEWPNHGSRACLDQRDATDPTSVAIAPESAIYTFALDEDTYILRENKCLNFEANFVYLLFGRDKVFLQDTGSMPRDFTRAEFAAAFPLRDKVEGIIGAWLTKRGRTRDSIELLVTHSHAHGDHVSGDFLFGGAPNTRVAGHRPEEVASFFGIENWPEDSASLDLGGRVLGVLPIPGHERSHVAVYDPQDGLLLTGDTLYPGHLFVDDWPAYRASLARLAAWTHETDDAGAPLRPIAYVLGNHIEKGPDRGRRSFYPYPSWVQDPERRLELGASHVDQLANATRDLGAARPGREIFFDDFSIDAE